MAKQIGRWCAMLTATGLVLGCGARRPDMQPSAPSDPSVTTATVLEAARPEIEAANAAWVRGMQQHQSALIATRTWRTACS